MIKLLQNFHRRHLRGRPFPESWQTILHRNVPFRARLDEAGRAKLDRGIVFFIDSRVWEGCGGLMITDDHRVTIAANAMRMTLGFDEDYFDDIETVLLYPTAYNAPSRQPIGSGMVLEGNSSRLGESWYHGPVILSWSDILNSLDSDNRPHNVILHEFAHQLDYRNGRDADGVPTIESDEQATEWIGVMQSAYERLCTEYGRGHHDAIDEYATTNMAEFFAVTTELFFEAPLLLAKHSSEVFRVMKRFYNQDPRN